MICSHNLRCSQKPPENKNLKKFLVRFLNYIFHCYSDRMSELTMPDSNHCIYIFAQFISKPYFDSRILFGSPFSNCYRLSYTRSDTPNSDDSSQHGGDGRLSGGVRKTSWNLLTQQLDSSMSSYSFGQDCSSGGTSSRSSTPLAGK